MTLMTLDLSAVTDSLIGLVKRQWTTAPIWTEVASSPPGPTFTPNFTGLAPEAARQQPGPQLSMYLYHVESDNARESLFWRPQMLNVPPDPAGGPTRLLPLALDLYYLLFAYSETSYIQEQEAMSVAARVFHANPIVRSGPGAAAPWELTLTMEHRSYDELSRLWQATTAPLRMSLVYRAAVVFIDSDPVPAAAPPVASLSLVPLPPPLPSTGAGRQPVLFGTFRDGSYTGEAGTAVSFSQSPATVAPGQAAWLVGSDLGASGFSDRLYLLPAVGGPETDVTQWAMAADVSGGHSLAVNSNGTRLLLTLPSIVGAPPAGAPNPGIYQLRVGSGALGSPGARRSGSIPMSVAAFTSPAGGPVLTGPGPFTVSGIGFISGMTEVLVGTRELTETAAPPGPGKFSIAPSGASFSFSPPPGAAGVVLPVQVRVNGIDSDPALWVTP
jgi:Pvc16 N-terminal domain